MFCCEWPAAAGGPRVALALSTQPLRWWVTQQKYYVL